MNVKEFLNKIRKIDMMIDCKLNQIRELRSLITGRGIRYDEDKVQTSLSNNDLMADTIANIVELEQKINVDIDELIRYKERARKMIEKLEDDVQKVVLYKRYFDYKTFEQIAVECGYSWRHVFRVHQSALKDLEKITTCHKMS